MQILKNSSKDIILIAFIYAFGMVLTYIVAALIGRLYGAESVGIYSLSIQLLTLATMVAVAGTNIAILKYVSKFNNAKERNFLPMLYNLAFKRIFIVSIILSIILYFSSELLANYIFDNTNYITSLKIIALLIPFSSVALLSKDFIKGLQLFKFSETLRTLSIPIINIVTILLLYSYWNSSSIITPLYGFSAGLIIVCLVGFIYIVTKYRKNYKSINLSLKKDFFKTSYNLLITQIILLLYTQVSLYFLEFFSNTKDVGIFHVHWKIASLCTLPLLISNVIMGPKISQLFEKNKFDLKKLLKNNSKIIFPISLIIGIIIVLFSDIILQIFGNDFSEIKITLFIIMISQIFNVFCGPSTIFLQMTGNENILKKNILIVLIASILINSFFVYYYGIIGACLAFTLNIILLNVLNVLSIKYRVGFETFFNPFSKISQ